MLIVVYLFICLVCLVLSSSWLLCLLLLVLVLVQCCKAQHWLMPCWHSTACGIGLCFVFLSILWLWLCKAVLTQVQCFRLWAQLAFTQNCFYFILFYFLFSADCWHTCLLPFSWSCREHSPWKKSKQWWHLILFPT